MTPVIEVSHLPTSASFYAAITQALGIRFLSCTPCPTLSTLHFGFPALAPGPGEIIFTLKQSPIPKLSTVTFAATSSSVVVDFYDRGLRAAPFCSEHSLKHSETDSTAQVLDPDGNMIEARYARRQSAPGIDITSPPKQARRVLDWQHDVAMSLSSRSSAASNRDASYLLAPRQQITRSVTDPLAYRSQDREPDSGERRSSLVSGISNNALIGTLLGAAAGAAVAYAMVRSEDPPRSGGGGSRSTRYRDVQINPEARQSRVYHYIPSEDRIIEIERRVASLLSAERDGRGQRYAVRYRVNGNRSASGSRSIHDEDAGNERSHVSRSRHSRGSKTKTEVSSSSRKSKCVSQRPLAITAGPSSHASGSRKSERSVDGDKTATVEKTANVADVTDVDDGGGGGEDGVAKSHSTYVSARSSGSTASTVRPGSKARSRSGTEVPSSSRSRTSSHREKGSEVGSRSGRSRRESVVTARLVPLPESVVSVRSAARSARLVPLPESIIGGGGSGEDDPQDGLSGVCSVAPSDSVSCAGSRREREREREREQERREERERLRNRF
ncbi:MAG: hypothetical protein M1818_000539 [Claussenomyces sp. TS43310]|nr:MAG: hypothetical protein M1818_000539 [Claussenomyces sp. TS43310]